MPINETNDELQNTIIAIKKEEVTTTKMAVKVKLAPGSALCP